MSHTPGTARAIYILYLVGLVLPIVSIVGVVMAYVNQGKSSPWLATHYRFQIQGQAGTSESPNPRYQPQVQIKLYEGVRLANLDRNGSNRNPKPPGLDDGFQRVGIPVKNIKLHRCVPVDGAKTAGCIADFRAAGHAHDPTPQMLQ